MPITVYVVSMEYISYESTHQNLHVADMVTMSPFFYYNASVAPVTKERIQSVVVQNVYFVK